MRHLRFGSVIERFIWWTVFHRETFRQESLAPESFWKGKLDAFRRASDDLSGFFSAGKWSHHRSELTTQLSTRANRPIEGSF